jgi:hypothetical protein
MVFREKYVLVDEPWQPVLRHYEVFMDIFHFNNNERFQSVMAIRIEESYDEKIFITFLLIK